MGEDIRLKSQAGDIGAYLAAPSGTPRGGIVVIQEIFGVNQHIRKVTDFFASQGYLALAPRFFDHIKPGIELGYTPDTIAEGRYRLCREPPSGRCTPVDRCRYSPMLRVHAAELASSVLTRAGAWI